MFRIVGINNGAPFVDFDLINVGGGGKYVDDVGSTWRRDGSATLAIPLYAEDYRKEYVRDMDSLETADTNPYMDNVVVRGFHYNAIRHFKATGDVQVRLSNFSPTYDNCVYGYNHQHFKPVIVAESGFFEDEVVNYYDSHSTFRSAFAVIRKSLDWDFDYYTRRKEVIAVIHCYTNKWRDGSSSGGWNIGIFHDFASDSHSGRGWEPTYIATNGYGNTYTNSATYLSNYRWFVSQGFVQDPANFISAGPEAMLDIAKAGFNWVYDIRYAGSKVLSTNFHTCDRATSDFYAARTIIKDVLSLKVPNSLRDLRRYCSGAIDWNSLATDAYNSVPLCSSNGIAYVKDSLEIADFTKGLLATVKTVLGGVDDLSLSELKSLSTLKNTFKGISKSAAGTKTGRKAARAVNRITRKQERQLRETGKAVTNTYLAMHYGAKLQGLDTVEFAGIIRSKNSMSYRVSRASANGTFQARKLPDWSIFARYDVYYDAFQPYRDLCTAFEDFLDLYDANITLENVWDMVPLSFVVDWFTHFGDFLNATDELYRLETKYNVLCVGQNYDATLPIDLAAYSPLLGGNLGLKYYVRYYNHHLVAPSFKIDAINSLNHLVEGTALVVSSLS